MIAIDTNVVVRFLTGDDPDQAERARALIETRAVFVPVTVVLECEWVLRSAYGFSRNDVAAALAAFGGLPGVTIEDAAAVAVALAATEMDFADALHLRRSDHCTELVTFDRRFAEVGGHGGRVRLL